MKDVNFFLSLDYIMALVRSIKAQQVNNNPTHATKIELCFALPVRPMSHHNGYNVISKPYPRPTAPVAK